LAEHALIGRKVAIKLLRADMPGEYVERFFNEAKAAATLHHPGLVDVFDFGHHADGRAFIVMELLTGESLAERLAREPRLPIALACAIARGVANALHVAHEQGIIHRDLKPANIFLISDPDAPAGVRTKVLDFGIAKLVREREARSVKTQSGAVIGTPRYMSPEQCKNARSVDGRSDIYALGCILYEMLLGIAPFDYDSWAELVGAHLYEVPPRPTEIDPELPADVETLVTKMLEKAPADRFQSMHDLAQSLEVLIAVHAGNAKRITPLSVPGITATPARGVKRVDSGNEPTLDVTPTSQRKTTLPPSTTLPGPPAATPAVPPGTRPAVPPGTTPASPPGTTPASPPALAAGGAPGTTPAAATEAAPASPRVTAPAGEPRTTPGAAPARKLPWLAIASGGIGLAALALAAFVVLGSERKPDPETAFIVVEHGSAEAGSATAKPLEPVALDDPVAVDAGVAAPPPVSDAGTRAAPPKPATATDLDALTRTFSKQSPAITACFKQHPDATEQVTIRIQIDTRGAVKAADVLPPSVGQGPLGACLVAVARATSFGPQPKPATFRVPLVKNER
jgi:serine/threonine-protein kinase